MGPIDSNFNFSRQGRPSSPPQTPTASTFQFGKHNNQAARRRSTVTLSGPRPQPRTNADRVENLEPVGGHAFNYNPYSLDSEISPRSSSPAPSDSDTSVSPPQSLSPSPWSRPGTPHTSPPTYTHIRTIPYTSRPAAVRLNFTISELIAQDGADSDNDDALSVIHPHAYESAHPSRAPSRPPSRSPNRPARSPSPASRSPSATPPPTTRQQAPNLTPRRGTENELNAHMLSDHLASLSCGSSDDERTKWRRSQRAKKRAYRLSTGSHKRSITQSIGSGTDDEDLDLPMPEGMQMRVPAGAEGEDGVGAEGAKELRRLRRKTNESLGSPRSPVHERANSSMGMAMALQIGSKRASLLFEDPPRMSVLREEEEGAEGLQVEMLDRGVEVPDVADEVDLDVFLRELKGYRYGGTDDKMVVDEDGIDEEGSED